MLTAPYQVALKLHALEQSIVRTSEHVQRVIRIIDPSAQIRDRRKQAEDSKECRSCSLVSGDLQSRGLATYRGS